MRTWRECCWPSGIGAATGLGGGISGRLRRVFASGSARRCWWCCCCAGRRAKRKEWIHLRSRNWTTPGHLCCCSSCSWRMKWCRRASRDGIGAVWRIEKMGRWVTARAVRWLRSSCPARKRRMTATTVPRRPPNRSGLKECASWCSTWCRRSVGTICSSATSCWRWTAASSGTRSKP